MNTPTLIPGELCACGVVATRTLGTIAYCQDCADSFLAPMMASRGIVVAPRPDWGAGWFDVQCRTCEAQWVGLDGEPCGWCSTRIEQTLADQAALLLRAPDNVNAIQVWADRLERAVDAGIITETQALRAWERRKVAA